MTPPRSPREAAVRRQLAAAVEPARLGAACAAYHDARVAGLCHEGAWEVALGARSEDPTSPLDPSPDPTRPHPR